MLAQERPVTVVCAVLECARSSSYCRPTLSPEEEAVKSAIREESAQWPRYGYRRITAQLQRRGRAVNRKRVRRRMREMGLSVRARKRKPRTTDSRHGFPRYPNRVQGLAIGRPHQVWVADITYIRAAGGFLCLALVMDVSTRAIRGWHLGRSLGQHLTLTALQRALDRHPAPEIHHSDSGVQYASPAYVRLLEERGVRISMAEVGEAWRNGYAERLIRTIKEEEVDLTEYLGCHDAHQQMSRFLEDVYMHQRIHSSLSYLTPAEFEERRHQEHSSGPEVELKMA